LDIDPGPDNYWFPKTDASLFTLKFDLSGCIISS
jgi:hypothetical protein